jgi:UDP-N-acetylglucosamine/UDP-N-acetylgalactosamine diphosphorylase
VFLDQHGTDSPQVLRERFTRYGQAHVFRFWDELDSSRRQALTQQAAHIDLDALEKLRRRALSLARPATRTLEPLPVQRLPESGGDATERGRARACGEALLGDGLVGVLVVAGGQGSRLGARGPKGAFPIGPLTNRSLLELLAQKLRGVVRRYGQRTPWYLMTSPDTDAEIRRLLAEEEHFGIDPEDLFIFCQQQVPAVDLEGMLMLERADRIAESPDGHGAVIPALLASGAFEHMEGRGVSTLCYCHVDNPLIPIADPVLLGSRALVEAEVVCKVVRKRDPAERLGTPARLDGHATVVEYTELEEPHRSRRDPDGELVFWAGAIGNHALDAGFLHRVALRAEQLLPYHASPKRIPCLDSAGQRVEPAEPNGYKLERFVFDAFAAASSVAVIEARRDQEYSPIKNATGVASPEVARRDLVSCYRGWLGAAGIALPEGDVTLELDHGWIDGPEDAEALGIRDVTQAQHVIRIATGVTG